MLLLVGAGLAMMPGLDPAPAAPMAAPVPGRALAPIPTSGPAAAAARAPIPVPPGVPAEGSAPWPQGAARVVDGDSLVVGGVPVRLHGIDAPETDALCTGADGRPYRCGRAATAVARALIGAQTVTCRDLGERTHDRVVAQCHVGGQDIAAALIAQGAVRACPRYAANYPHSAGYLGLERQAAAARRGLHAGIAPPRARYCTTAASDESPPRPIPASVGDCVIKGNITREGQRIYHLPGQRHYADTVISPARGERWFCSEAEARAAGWQRARR